MKRFFRWFIRVKIPLYLSITISILLGIIVWGSTVYFFFPRTTIGEVNMIGIGVGVHWDANGDNPIKTLSWGNITINPLQPKITKNVTAYIRNEGNEIIVLQLNTSNWQPATANMYISLSWDYNGQDLGTKETIKITLFLSVNPKIWFRTSKIQDYSFDIIISAKAR